MRPCNDLRWRGRPCPSTGHRYEQQITSWKTRRKEDCFVLKIGTACKVTLRSHPSQRAAAGEGEPHSHFQTVSYNALFGNILKNVPIRKRPPQSYCDMCVGSPALRLEVVLLDSMLSLDGECEEEEKEYQEWHWGEYKTRENAVARLRKCKRMLQARDQHKIWVASQRIAVSLHVCMGGGTHNNVFRSGSSALASSLC